MPTRKELVAYQKSNEEIALALGADAVVFMDIKDLKACCTQFNKSITEFEDSVFTGSYVCGSVTEDVLNNLEAFRGINRL